MNQIDLSGRVAVITGGGSGLGYATAQRFLNSGATVEIWGHDAAMLDAARASLEKTGNVVARQVDVASWDQVDGAARQAQAQHGYVDILVNFAGISLVGSLNEMSLAEWHNNIAVNLNGVFFCCRAFVPGMVERGYGRIVNTSSMAGKEGNAQMSAYSAAKGAVIAFTKSIAKELATTGVIVNAIAPALFDTPLMRSTLGPAPDILDLMKQKMPMQRIGRPEEAAALVAWMCSSECSFSTGFTFDLSGGKATY